MLNLRRMGAALSVLMITGILFACVSILESFIFINALPAAVRYFGIFSQTFIVFVFILSMFFLTKVKFQFLEHDFHLQEALDEMKRLTSVIDQSFDGIVITDLWGVIRHVNPQWSVITGWSAEEVEGKMTPAILKSGLHDANFYSNMWVTIQNGKTFQGELVNKRKDGTFYRVNEIVLPLKNHEGRVVGYAAFHHVLDSHYQAV